MKNSVHSFSNQNKTLSVYAEREYFCDGFPKNNKHITISNKWTDKDKEDVFIISSANNTITRRDNLKNAIKENIDTPEVFGLHPKRETIYVNGKRTVLRALFIDSLEEHIEKITEKVSKAFKLEDPDFKGLR